MKALPFCHLSPWSQAWGPGQQCLLDALKSGGRWELCRAWEPASVSKFPSTFSSCDYLPSTKFPDSWTSLLILHPTSHLHSRNDTSGRSRLVWLQIWLPFQETHLEKMETSQLSDPHSMEANWHLDPLTVANRWGFMKAPLGLHQSWTQKRQVYGCQTVGFGGRVLCWSLWT